MKQLSKSLKIIIKPTASSGTEAADELTKWLEKLWGRSLIAGITDLRLEAAETHPSRPSALPEDENKPSDEHLLMELPQQVCECVLLAVAKKSYVEKSEGDVAASGGIPYGDSSTGFELEAWGSSQSLQMLRGLIANEEAKAKPRLQDAAGAINFGREKARIMTVFKNCSSASSVISFKDYDGECQFIHHSQLKRIPRVRNPLLESSFGHDKFIERSMQQLGCINANYDEVTHGRMRAVISYGTLYVANCTVPEVPESEFDGLFASGSEARRAASLDSIRGRSRGRDRRPRGRGFVGNFPPRSNSYISASFIPTGNPHIYSSRLQDFLQNYGFVLAEEKVDYRLSLKLSISGQRLKLDAEVVLGENFDLKYISMPDVKWLCVNVVSANKDSNYRPYDSRFKIHSRVKRTVLQLKRESADFADIVAKHRTMLLRNGNEIHGVHRDFVAQVKFVRKKDTKVYRLAPDQHGATTDAFLYGMAIRINYGTEYSNPSPTGEFQDVDRNRVEVTALPELPDFRDEDKMRTFFTKCWDFAEELGSVLE